MTAKVNGRLIDLEVREVIDRKTAGERNLPHPGVFVRAIGGKNWHLVPFDQITFIQSQNDSEIPSTEILV